MEIYQKIVLGIAIVLLIAAYIMIFFTLVESDLKWPPTISKCPDFWVYNGKEDKCQKQGSSLVLDNVSKLSKCDKYNWSTTTQSSSSGPLMYIPWDGLNYGVNIDC